MSLVSDFSLLLFFFFIVDITLSKPHFHLGNCTFIYEPNVFVILSCFKDFTTFTLDRNISATDITE